MADQRLAERPKNAPLASCMSAGDCQTLCQQCRVRVIAVCAALEPDELAEIEAITDHRTLEARRTLFGSGEAADAVYTITSGTMRLYNDLADGRRQIIGFATAGDFLGLALPDVFGFTAESITGVTLCRFGKAQYLGLVARKPALLRRLHHVATHELTIAQDHMMVLGRRRAEERVAAFLLRWRERLAPLQGFGATVPLPMGRQDIADHLGLTIETVSRIFARWMRERVILDVPDGIRVLDAARLEAAVAG
jgi:CRP/FNR family transcriptional regulator